MVVEYKRYYGALTNQLDSMPSTCKSEWSKKPSAKLCMAESSKKVGKKWQQSPSSKDGGHGHAAESSKKVGKKQQWLPSSEELSSSGESNNKNNKQTKKKSKSSKQTCCQAVVSDIEQVDIPEGEDAEVDLGPAGSEEKVGEHGSH